MFSPLFIFRYSSHHFLVSGKQGAAGISYSLALKKLVQGSWSHCIVPWSADLHRNLDLDLELGDYKYAWNCKILWRICIIIFIISIIMSKMKFIITPCVPPAEREFEVCMIRNSLCWNQTGKLELVVLHVMSSAKVLLYYCLVIFIFLFVCLFQKRYISYL